MSINPPTPLEKSLKYIDKVDMVLMMSVNPGYAGQKFIPAVLENIRKLRKLKPNIDIVSKAKTQLQLEIDKIARQDLELVKLPEALSSIKKQLARMPQDTVSAYLDYLKTALDLNSDFIQGLKKEIKSITELNKSPNESPEKNMDYKAIFPGLVDVVQNDDGDPAFLILEDERLRVES